MRTNSVGSRIHCSQ